MPVTIDADSRRSGRVPQEKGPQIRAVQRFWARRNSSGALPPERIVGVETGRDNLAATFSPELADLTIYVIDVFADDKIPRKGGPGITRSDLLVIDKIDLAPHVGADLDIMNRDAGKMRAERPFLFTNVKAGQGTNEVRLFVERQGGLSNAGLDSAAR